ncbi:hypothetical protein [Algisphaera agarilytica]|uniref:Uncharacterized protein n=1 Tax=Algisphaera agarilytica TaxID=1385975 RepID=A0A7X0LJL1_9BACT|nr:hypothetical protein [Algisphaera agarilytica]MBB6429480.1 hypothetical protein [Algisphaera agarilytica]
MRTLAAMSFVLLCLSLAVSLAPPTASGDVQTLPDTRPAAAASPYFEAVPVVIDPQGQPLAAYQFELSSPNAELTIVGLENGEHPAFADAPFYDTDAVNQGRADRIIVAAYSLLPGEELPNQPTRVATVMVQVQLSPDAEPGTVAEYQLDLITAGNPAGEPIPAALFRGAQP